MLVEILRDTPTLFRGRIVGLAAGIADSLIRSGAARPIPLGKWKADAVPNDPPPAPVAPAAPHPPAKPTRTRNRP